jgi:hypothetical protein
MHVPVSKVGVRTNCTGVNAVLSMYGRYRYHILPRAGSGVTVDRHSDYNSRPKHPTILIVSSSLPSGYYSIKREPSAGIREQQRFLLHTLLCIPSSADLKFYFDRVRAGKISHRSSHFIIIIITIIGTYLQYISNHE